MNEAIPNGKGKTEAVSTAQSKPSPGVLDTRAQILTFNLTHEQ